MRRIPLLMVLSALLLGARCFRSPSEIPPWDTPLGGEIFIHGGGSGSDWTWGCVALDDDDVRELYRAVRVGTPVTIEP